MFRRGGRFAEVLDRLPAAVAVLQGPELEVEYSNPQYQELAAGDLPADLLRTVQSGGEPRYLGETPMAGRFWDLAIVPLAGGESLVVHAVDVSEQVAARRRAEELERRYTAFVDSNVIGVTITDEERLHEANDAFLDMLGYTREDLQRGLRWTDLSDPESREADDRAIRLLRETGVAPPFEKSYLRRDGGRAEVLLSGTRISEEPFRVLATIYDLGERRAADREIHRLLHRERDARMAAELAHARTRRLQELTGSLSATLSTAEMARVVVNHAVEDLNAAAGSLSRIDGADIRVDYAIGYAPEVLEAWRRFPLMERTPISDAVRSGEPVILTGESDWDTYPDLISGPVAGSAIALPLVVRGHPIGALALSFDERRDLATEDVGFLLALAQQAATAIERAELFENRAYVARKLQEGLLPQRLEALPGLQTAVRYASISGGGEVGGDFYDVFSAGENCCALAVGDVCGKGTEAAVVTGLARHTVRAVARMGEGPSGTLRFLNDALRRQAAVPAFCTVLCGIVRPASDGFLARLASGGHPGPLVLRAEGAVEEVDVTGTMLGVAADLALEEVEVSLAPGDALVAYTDGVTDARLPGGERFGEQRLRETLQGAAGRDADGIAAVVEAAVRGHDPGPPAEDLATVVILAAP